MDFAWLAGLIDAEGCFHLRRHHTSPTVNGFLQIEMKDIQVMRKVASVFRLIIGYKPKIHTVKRKDGREIFRITINRKNALEKIIEKLYPFLVGKKKIVAYFLRGLLYHDPDDHKQMRNPEPSRYIPEGVESRHTAARAWLAGFIDGDGCCSGHFSVNNTRKENIQFVKAVCDSIHPTGNRIRKRILPSPRHQDQYVFEVNNKSFFRRLIAALADHLSEVKLRQLAKLVA